jgi:hypothetical protein
MMYRSIREANSRVWCKTFENTFCCNFTLHTKFCIKQTYMNPVFYMIRENSFYTDFHTVRKFIDCSFPGCDAVESCRWRRNVSLSALKMETIRLSEALVTTYKTMVLQPGRPPSTYLLPREFQLPSVPLSLLVSHDFTQTIYTSIYFLASNPFML